MSRYPRPLQFAVAAHLDPEILIVDEVLAVGDAEFQKKCLGKMEDVAGLGRTVLFVSHNMEAVRSFCTRVIRLDEGRLVQEGPTSDVVHDDLRGGGSEGETSQRVLPRRPVGEDKAAFRAVRFSKEGGDSISFADISETIAVEVEYEVLQAGARLNISLSLFSEDGVYVLSSPSISDSQWYQRPHPAGLYRTRCTIPGNLLNSGRYFVSLLLVEPGPRVFGGLDRVVSMEMRDSGEVRAGYYGGWAGVVRPQLPWATERVGHGATP